MFGYARIDASKLGLKELKASNNQVFYIEEDEQGYISITSAHANLRLDAAFGKTDVEAFVVQHSCTESFSQRWIAERTEEGLLFISGNSSANQQFVLGLEDGIVERNKKLVVQARDASLPQTFRLMRLKEVLAVMAKKHSARLSDTEYVLASSTKFSLALSSRKLESGKFGQILTPTSGTDAQRWRVEVDKQGYIRLKNKATGLYLGLSGSVIDAHNLESADTSAVNMYVSHARVCLQQQKDDVQSFVQKWVVVPYKKSLHLVSAACFEGGFCAVVPAKRKPLNGTSIEIRPLRGGLVEYWMFLDPATCKTVSKDASVAVRFSNVTKSYKLYENDRLRFAGAFIKRIPYKTVHANDGLSFEIRKGEAVAFLGKNGAGKSTALKMITGVCRPTTGSVEVRGHVSALLELSAGFDKRLTGLENLKMRCQLRGMNAKKTAEALPDMVDFAELGEYINQPLRMYSSGMRARLGFAFAVSAHPDILLVDEVLSVGDKSFKQKCLARVREIVSDDAVTVIFVTHASGVAQEFCRRGIVLECGKVVFDGPIADAIAFYDSRA